MASGSSNSSFINRSLNRSQADLQKSFQKLSSGKRINSAADDAAGLAIAEALKSEAVVLKQANRNISDGQSSIEIADSALNQVSSISTRLQELATQSANGTLSDTQRVALNTEFQALTQEVQRIGATTEFNGKPLLDGSETTIQAGSDASANSQISTAGVDISSAVSSVASQSIATVDQARAAITAVQSFASSITQSRGDLGSTDARLRVASNNNEERRINTLSAESRIRDVDVAEESATLVSRQIRQKAATALSAQANLQSSRVIDLLK